MKVRPETEAEVKNRNGQIQATTKKTRWTSSSSSSQISQETQEIRRDSKSSRMTSPSRSKSRQKLIIEDFDANAYPTSSPIRKNKVYIEKFSSPSKKQRIYVQDPDQKSSTKIYDNKGHPRYQKTHTRKTLDDYKSPIRDRRPYIKRTLDDFSPKRNSSKRRKRSRSPQNLGQRSYHNLLIEDVPSFDHRHNERAHRNVQDHQSRLSSERKRVISFNKTGIYPYRGTNYLDKYMVSESPLTDTVLAKVTRAQNEEARRSRGVSSTKESPSAKKRSRVVAVDRKGC